jgi:exodeoxyribonuclease V alpha subunit
MNPLDLYFANLHKDATEEERALLAAIMASAREGHLCFDLDHWSGIQAVTSPYLHQEGRLIYLRRNFACENEIATLLKKLIGPMQPPAYSTEGLTEEQAQAVHLALSNTISIIEGGPGTGKTHLTSAIVKAVGKDVVLAAPTGKAAARLKKYNPEFHCSTLHALLGLPKHEKTSYIRANLIVVDESSMVDARLLAHFLRSLRAGQRVVFLGDGHQLPPIESGSLFTDLIDWVPTAHLSKCLRSDRKDILQLAQDILAGKIVEPHEPLSEDKILAAKETMILTPLREGPWGVEALNQLIFSEIKKPDGEIWSIPILITKTDYEAQLYNGELGTLWRTNVKPLYAEFDGRKIPASRLPPYELAFVLSVHKSQGSEFDHVMVLVPPGSENFGREVLYTAVTRARHSVTLCGDMETIEKTVTRSSQRTSGVRNV